MKEFFGAARIAVMMEKKPTQIPLSFILAAVLACSSSSPGPAPKTEVLQISGGWHLLSTSDDALSAVLNEASLVKGPLFVIDQGYDAATQRVVPQYIEVDAWRSKESYWLYVAPDGEPLQNEDLRPPDPRSTGPGMGYFLRPPRTIDTTGITFLSIRAWDVANQSFVDHDASQALLKGHTYWVETEKTCDPQAWSFSDAVRLLRQCQLTHAAFRMLPGTEGQPVGEQSVGTPTGLVLHLTRPGQPLNVREVLTEAGAPGAAGPEAPDFFIAQDEAGAWQIYDAVQPSTEERETVHIAVVAPSEGDGEEGFRAQPQPGAAIRLMELVALLAQENDGLTEVFPFGLLPESADEASGWPSLPTHWVAGLSHRFFPQADAASPPTSFLERLLVRGDEKDTAPLLLVEPQGDPLYSAQPHFVLSGNVLDTDLLELTIEGVLVAEASQSFTQAVWLSEGENTIRLEAIDEVGQVKTVVRKVIYDTLAPVIELVTPDSGPLDSAAVDITVTGTVTEAHLETFSVNGEAIFAPGGVFEKTFAGRGHGLHHFEFLARDESGLETRVRLSVMVDENGIKTIPQTPERPPLPPDPGHSGEGGTEAMPLLRVHHPELPLSFSRVPVVRIEGHVEDPHLSFVRINEIVSSTVSGDFFGTVRLQEEETVLTLVAQNVSKQKTELSRRVVFDPVPPVIHLENPAKRSLSFVTSYEISGTVEERFLSTLSVTSSAGADVAAIHPDAAGRFRAIVPIAVGANHFTLRAEDLAGNKSSVDLELTRASEEEMGQDPAPPSHLIAWATGDVARLRWQAPKERHDGSALPEDATLSYRVFRDGIRVAEGTSLSYRGVVPQNQRSYAFHVVAVLHEGDTVLSSRPVERAELEVGLARLELPLADGFDSAERTAEPAAGSAAIPIFDFSELDGRRWTHLAFVFRSPEGEGDAIRYQRSDGDAKVGSWRTADAIASSGKDWQISELCVAAREHRVVLTWLELSKGGLNSRIQSLESGDGGENFAEARTLRRGGAWKRDLSCAFDRLGHHHLVWGEAGRVHYLKDFEGERDSEGKLVNVFDETKRWVNGEIVTYHHILPTQCDPGESCCNHPYDDTYSLGIEPKDEAACGGDRACRQETFGVYLERTEVVHVETPSLEVTDDGITIIARQTRMFDNIPYPNPEWRGLPGHGDYPFFGPLVPDPEWSLGAWCASDSRRFQMGFRKTRQKDQYLCPPEVPANALELLSQDEILDSGAPRRTKATDFYAYDHRVGHPSSWYQFSHAGRWHEADAIKIAERPVERGAWSDIREETRLTPKIRASRGEAMLRFEETQEAVEYGFHQGNWRRGPASHTALPGAGAHFEETKQSWRISTVETFSSEREGEYTACGQAPNAAEGSTGPAYPIVATHGDRRYAIYEKGTSTNPNLPGGNSIHLSYSVDGGRNWTAVPDPIAHGYKASATVTAGGELLVAYYEPSFALRTDEGAPLGRIRIARSQDGIHFTHGLLSKRYDEEAGQWNEHPASPIHWTAYGSQADAYLNLPVIKSRGDLSVVTWVEYPQSESEQPRIVTVRTSPAAER